MAPSTGSSGNDRFIEGLVRPFGVVVSDPPIDRCLGRGQGGERGRLVEEVGSQGAVEPLDAPMFVKPLRDWWSVVGQLRCGAAGWRRSRGRCSA
jgi:hypothetical protein